ncbi:hypothetical protein PISMIDRAFT_11118 [Pisolithus microcarpus 441]|uniref:Uncharacterized protein n=1 Tax=Pisolithus microcarpus 441 TaxID=765257 RepID=A0A0C9ZB04_9AGAM|nr:hypothetical protein BKA83DRAFT_11118 [Pisolithus microcarpus]KIK23129.1 hypothetical protein PISMIDRAFT_11118 [Pisolithus microcarpus 441]
MPSWNSHSMFTRSALYPCPTSKSSSSASGQRQTPCSISTKLTSAGVCDVITQKVEDLDKESDVFEEELDACTCCAAMWYNYLICKEELELQQDENSSQMANAEAVFCCEQELKKLDVKLKKAEETSFNWQLEMLHLQIQLKNIKETQLHPCLHHPPVKLTVCRSASFFPKTTSTSYRLLHYFLPPSHILPLPLPCILDANFF